jgi:hypothetical protein
MKSNRPRRNEWVEYNIYPELKSVNARARAKIDGKNALDVELLFNAPKGQYYSFIEDAKTEAVRLFSKYYKVEYA